MIMLKKIIISFLLFSSQILISQIIKRDLSNEKWTFTQEGKNELLKATVPGTVHTDLFNNKLIPDPFFGDNEQKLQWIENKNWIYKTDFLVSEKELKHSNLNLIFYGLDTFADVFLNGKKILSANNMFRTWEIDVKPHLKSGNNELKIFFHSASAKGKQLASQLPYRLPENERVFVRKAQHHFGWDWGPRYVTAGIWKPVVLEMWNAAKIENISFTQELNENSASIKFISEIRADKPQFYDIKINEKTFTVQVKEGLNSISNVIKINQPKLWYPNGFGEPHLYPFTISLNSDNTILDQKSLNIGLRKIELVEEPDEIGKSFYFKVNGIPVYAKGANVIPPKHFVPSADKNIYKKWMEEAKFANMNMLRIWGGGVYPDDEFYDEADRNGILIWQDFMFACAMYPADKDFLENVKQEFIDQTKRLQNHASLAIWCGNNENDEGWHNWGWQKQLNYSKQDSAKVWNDYVKVFREIIPQTLDSVSAQKPIYWQSSPSNGWGREIAYNEGDVHYWGVWWGMEPFEKYREKTGRFVSEYGFQGMPPVSAFKKFTSTVVKDEIEAEKKRDEKFLDSDRNERSDKIELPEFLNHPEIKAHQKHPTGYETILEYMKRDYHVPDNFEDFAYVSQLLQARGMKIAVEAHRQKKPMNMGTLYWQLNDVWPVTSWSSIDFYGNRKAAHYQFKRSFEPVVIIVDETEETYDIWVNNDSKKDFGNSLSLELLDFSGEKLFAAEVAGFTPKLSNELISKFPKKYFSEFDLTKAVWKLTWESDNKEVTIFHFFVKPKNLALDKPNISIKRIDAKTVEISTDILAKDVYLISEEAGNFSDNFFDLLPGEKKMVTAEKDFNDLKIKSLADILQ